MRLINTLIRLAEYFKDKPDIIQGAGGNISIKSEDEMVIKASGVNFHDINELQGFSFLSHHQLVNEMSNFQTDQAYTEYMNECYDKNRYAKPSMETGFHAALDTVVIHTHDVYANMFLCSKEGQYELSSLFPDSMIIDFYLPGFNLSRYFIENKCSANTYFLKNHGLIISATNEEQAIECYERVHNSLKHALKITDVYPKIELFKENNYFVSETNYGDFEYIEPSELLELFKTKFLFPDQAIYAEKDLVSILKGRFVFKTQNYKLARSVEEVLLSYYKIYNGILSRGWEPDFLSKDTILQIVTMPAERFRKGVINQ